jgi:hypothetical protein
MPKKDPMYSYLGCADCNKEHKEKDTKTIFIALTHEPPEIGSQISKP